jgi:spore germination cell wall hydrolase CwlJ-like protein
MTGIDAALICLALNVYKEARGEPIAGQQAVALVTINRAKLSGRDVCDVVMAPKQFSWTATDMRHGRLKHDKRPDTRGREWQTAVGVARVALWGVLPDFTGGATHYHRHDVAPAWGRSMRPLGRWGNHLFY